MTRSTINACASLSRAACAKGLMGDARKDEKRAFGRQIRRAGRVSIADALTECDDDQDDQDEIRNAVERAECADWDEIERLVAEIERM